MYRFALKSALRDIAQNKAIITDRLGLKKEAVTIDEIPTYIHKELESLQSIMLARAFERRKAMWHKAVKLTDFGPKLVENNGFYQVGWCQQKECEAKLREYQATTRVLLNEKTSDVCFNCDRPSITDVIVAKAY